MKIEFSKYHGAGNDFILIDNTKEHINLTNEHISHLCNRHFGIGADGLIYLLPSSEFDFKMKYFNADGKEGSMCGNGGRCISAFAFHILNLPRNFCFEAIDGIHRAEVLNHAGTKFNISISMLDVTGIIESENYYFLNTGSPHYVEFIENPDSFDVAGQGKKIRWDKRFQPEGTNVNFVSIQDNHIYVQTFERGVENITLSCGTGITASAIAAALKNKVFSGDVNVVTRGGNLHVRFDKTGNTFTNIILTGPAVKSFEGHFTVENE